MSLITQCPACETRFRVVPDQLKISDGWVRCGQCAEVFDAGLSLRPAAPHEMQAPAPAQPQPQPQADPAEGKRPVVPARPDPDPAPETEPEPEPEPEHAALPASPPQPEADLERLPWPVPVQAPAPEPEPDGKREPVLEPVAAGAAFPPAHEQVAFLRQARRRATWERPAVRLALALLVVLLGLLLAGQLALQHSERLLQQWPALRPLMTILCQPPACRLGPPQRLEAIRIDSSAFNQLQPDTYQLQFTLANQSQTPIAMPALELTLTDTQDQPVLRRILQPADLGPETPASIAPSGEWSSVLTFQVAPDAGSSRITGYRLLAFYP